MVVMGIVVWVCVCVLKWMVGLEAEKSGGYYSNLNEIQQDGLVP